MKRNSVLYVLLVLFFCTACSDGTVDQSLNKKSSVYPEQESADFQQFTKQCSGCHRPPMPNIHSAGLWVTTLYRMQKHRQHRGLVLMSEAEQQQVLAYLQRHSQEDG